MSTIPPTLTYTISILIITKHTMTHLFAIKAVCSILLVAMVTVKSSFCQTAKDKAHCCYGNDKKAPYFKDNINCCYGNSRAAII